MVTCLVGGGKRTMTVVHRGVAVNLKKARLSELRRGTMESAGLMFTVICLGAYKKKYSLKVPWSIFL